MILHGFVFVFGFFNEIERLVKHLVEHGIGHGEHNGGCGDEGD